MSLFWLKKYRVISKSIVLLVILGWLFTGWPPINNIPLQIEKGYASTTDTYTSSTTWTAPTGVTSVIVEVWGSGGAGGGNDDRKDGAGGGGGGAYSKDNAVTVVPDTGYTVTVGAIGTGVAGGTGGDGGASWFIDVGTVYAEGGFGGAFAPIGGSGGAGGAGGSLDNGIGDVVTSGGSGGAGKDANTGVGGGGGGSGGTVSNGNNGATGDAGGAGATAVTGGGPGGNGTVGTGAASAGGNGYAGQVSITYDRLPNAPTQYDPSNGLTDVSITPTFTMTATEPDGDDISYKVTIYSASGCSSGLVSTHDQAVTSTGWSGQDASCTAEPTSCYASGTQGSFALQAGDALANETQYWWKASVKDPDGTGTFVDSSTCNNFTTVAEVAVSISLDTSGSVDFGYVALDTSQDSTATGVDDVETIRVDTGPADLDIKSTNFTEGGNTWTLGASNNENVVQWDYSSSTTPWYNFTVALDNYALDNNVAQGQTRDIYLKITMPTLSDSYSQYSTTVTITASAP